MIKRSLVNLVLKYRKEHGVYKINPDDNFDYEDEDEEDNNNKEEDKKNNEYIPLNDEYDNEEDDDDFSLFTQEKKTDTKKPPIENENIINENKIGKNLIEEQKMKLINGIYSLSNIFFSNAKIFLSEKYNPKIIIDNYKFRKEKEEIYKTFFNFL